MDKGWGLALDSDPPISLFSNLSNKPSSAPVLDSLFKIKRNLDVADSVKMFPFPVNVSRRDDQASSSSADDNRVVVGEVDFFSDKRNRAVGDNNNNNDNDDSKATRVTVKKENSYGEAAPRSSLDVNVRTVIHQSWF